MVSRVETGGTECAAPHLRFVTAAACAFFSPLCRNDRDLVTRPPGEISSFAVDIQRRIYKSKRARLRSRAPSLPARSYQSARYSGFINAVDIYESAARATIEAVTPWHRVFMFNSSCSSALSFSLCLSFSRVNWHFLFFPFSTVSCIVFRSDAIEIGRPLCSRPHMSPCRAQNSPKRMATCNRQTKFLLEKGFMQRDASHGGRKKSGRPNVPLNLIWHREQNMTCRCHDDNRCLRWSVTWVYRIYPRDDKPRCIF